MADQHETARAMCASGEFYALHAERLGVELRQCPSEVSYRKHVEGVTYLVCGGCGRRMEEDRHKLRPNPKTFKIMQDQFRARSDRYRGDRHISAIPWGMIFTKTARRQAVSNHSQSVHRLHERGGLTPREAVVVLEGRDYDWPRVEQDSEADRAQNAEAVVWLERLVSEHDSP